ncbi:hypothetical protein [Actinoplanes solisilvae]|uniref:hypothetical protein n=1 Tax=Actinoplanes solisilvae TaxID=2486853 RepID=UPI000FD9E09F|nr:hypothetical protein [Actinoplanes solisilvae]
MSSLLAAIASHAETADYLCWPGDFELDRKDHVEEVHLASGALLEGFAGDGSGGTFFFCGPGGEERPVLYADSEGGAALVAFGLEQLLQLIMVAPWWTSYYDFSERERSELAAEYRADIPDLDERRDRAAAALGLELPTEAEVVTRLRAATAEVGDDYTLVFTPEGNVYERLFTA